MLKFFIYGHYFSSSFSWENFFQENWKSKCKKSETNAQVAIENFESLNKINETLNENIKKLTNELEAERKRTVDLG